jgi:hypothetical protein
MAVASAAGKAVAVHPSQADAVILAARQVSAAGVSLASSLEVALLGTLAALV